MLTPMAELGYHFIFGKRIFAAPSAGVGYTFEFTHGYNSLDEDRAGSFDYVADQSGRRGGDKNAAEQFLMRIAQMEQQFKAQKMGIPELPPGVIKNNPSKTIDSPKK